MDNQNSYNKNLLKRLSELERKQDALNVEIHALKAEVKGKGVVQAQPTMVAAPQEIVKTEPAY
ncbi:hypothetical protein MNBD_BACTEROID06-880, partial [hydrothermal vent metagenome]